MNSVLLTIALVASAVLLAAAFLIRLSVRRPGWTRRIRSWAGVTIGSLLVVLSLLALVGVYFDARRSGPLGLPTPEQWAATVPTVEYRRISDGSEARLAEHRGKVVLLNLWASWCAPCLGEMPVLESLQAELGERGLVVVTLSNDPLEKIRELSDRMPSGTVNVYADDDDLPLPFRRAFSNLPLTYVIDREGRFADAFLGTRSYEAFAAKVEPLL